MDNHYNFEDKPFDLIHETFMQNIMNYYKQTDKMIMENAFETSKSEKDFLNVARLELKIIQAKKEDNREKLSIAEFSRILNKKKLEEIKPHKPHNDQDNYCGFGMSKAQFEDFIDSVDEVNQIKR